MSAASRDTAGGSRTGSPLWSAALWGGLLLVLLSGVGCGGPSHEWRGQVVQEPEPMPALPGVNWDGQPFDPAVLQGKVSVVFFGYTFCPDICPFTLAKLKQVAAELGPLAADLRVVFVSVDPHRDSVEKLASYVPNFDRAFYGLRVEHDDMEALQDGWGLTVQYGQPKDGPGTDSYYYVDHTGTYFLIDRNGTIRLTFPPNAQAPDLKADLEALLGEKA